MRFFLYDFGFGILNINFENFWKFFGLNGGWFNFLKCWRNVIDFEDGVLINVYCFFVK